jgi:hypothetical protein
MVKMRSIEQDMSQTKEGVNRKKKDDEEGEDVVSRGHSDIFSLTPLFPHSCSPFRKESMYEKKASCDYRV